MTDAGSSLEYQIEDARDTNWNELSLEMKMQLDHLSPVAGSYNAEQRERNLAWRWLCLCWDNTKFVAVEMVEIHYCCEVFKVFVILTFCFHEIWANSTAHLIFVVLLITQWLHCDTHFLPHSCCMIPVQLVHCWHSYSIVLFIRSCCHSYRSYCHF